MKITVIGTGYVGLVTGTCLSEVGNDVLCFDTNAEKIAALKEGVIPIFEPGLEEMVLRNIKAGRLHFTDDIEDATRFGTVQFIAVGTPPGEDGGADVGYVMAAARNIGKHMNDYKVVVDKSTVPVGTNQAVAERLAAAGCPHVDVASNPEFLKEGAAVQWVMDAFGHLKAIGASDAAKPLLDKAGIEPDAGVVALADIATAGAKRYWDREPGVRTLA